MNLSRQKILSLTVLLAVVVLAAGCMQNGELALVSSNLTQDAEIDPSLENIKLEFSQPIVETQVSLSANKEAVEVDVKKNDKVVNIKSLELKPFTEYQLQVSVQNDQGTQLQDVVSFQTGWGDYPQVARKNKTLMQTFYWEMGKGEYAEKYPEETNLWKVLAKRADNLADKGITEVWIPPASKANEMADEGYALYDPWDLGEFDQGGSVRTKYGTKEQLETAIDELHQEDIEVYFDAVLNQRIALGKKNLEEAPLKSGKKRKVYTKIYPLKGRQKYYSKADEWKWNWKAFDGVDYAEDVGDIGSTLFKGKSWDDTYDKDYLLGADVDYENQQVSQEMKAWGQWLINDIGFDGFRVDAVKHIDSGFISSWVSNIQKNTEQDVKFIGEAWIRSSMGLKFYLMSVDNPELDLFDFGLRNTFTKLRNGLLNMSSLSSAGLVNTDNYQDRAVTFVDNHDTGRDSSDHGQPIDKRKMQAYTYILTHERGLPMVYWKDYYVSGYQEDLDKLLEVRKYFAYGSGRAAETSDRTVYSYVREGLEDKPGTGLVMMITDGKSGETVTKRVNTGQPNTTFYDYTANVKGKVTTDDQGYGEFKVKNTPEDGWSVWVPKK